LSRRIVAGINLEIKNKLEKQENSKRNEKEEEKKTKRIPNFLFFAEIARTIRD
jgi:hypothetical protein